MTKKKVAIAADNYKLERFKKKLTEAGFKDFVISKFTADTSTIKLIVPSDKVMEISKICKEIELHYHRGN